MFVVRRSHHNPILIPDKDHYWEAFATFNMSVVKKGTKFFGVYRAISAEDKLRSPRRISTIGIGESKDGYYFDNRQPFIAPEEGWEAYGCEDPRITYFEGNYYIFYTALSKYPFEASGIRVAVALSKDLKKIKERHLVTPFNAKSMTLFPERINGKITVVLAANTDMPPVKVAIAQMDNIEDLWSESFWNEWYKNVDKYVINIKKSEHDHIEVGATPIKTEHGWLFIYSHIENYFPGGDHERVFGVRAVVLDLNDPTKVIGQNNGSLFAPREPYELTGFVPNVVFPSGAVVDGKQLSIYYGAADTSVCIARVNLNDLLGSILPEKSERWHFKRFSKNPIITPDKTHPWESKATFNPAAFILNDIVHILYRSSSEDNTSYIGYATSEDGFNIKERLAEPIYVPREDFESKKVAMGNSGCEDPRIIEIGNTIYMCYTAFDGIGPPRVAITSITKKDFLKRKWSWEKPVLITPPGFDDKDTCILPDKVNGQYFILHRVGDEICGDYFKTLDFKKQTVNKCIRIIGPRINTWDSWKVGISAPPIKTKYGWLLIYHGVSKNHSTYRLGAVLLDLKDPAIVIARSTDAIMEPKEEYEKIGVVNNVVFPCGMVVKDNLLFIYYGGADTVVGVATMELDIILAALTRDLKMKKK